MVVILPLLEKKLIINRDICEKELSLALSRYIGYTTGAYNIFERLKEILPEFDGKPYLLDIELRNKLKVIDNITDDYASGIINFATGLRFIVRHDHGSQTARFSMTDIGRSCWAAMHMNDEEYERFIFTYSVLEFDCDVYGLLLDLACNDGLPTGEALHDEFLKRTNQLRDKRFEWLYNAFPNRILRERIERQVLWIKAKGVNISEKISPRKDFARHHATPRKGWAKSLGHLDEAGKLTKEGKRVLLKLKGNEKKYFWLAPKKECFEKLQIKNEFGGISAPAWNLLRGEKESGEGIDDVIEKISDYMLEYYQYLRLAKMNQASITSVLPYLYFLEKKVDRRFDEQSVIKRIFSEKRDLFSVMSKRDNLYGYYQCKKKVR